MILDLFTRCVLISLLAFGGGQAALPLIERIAVGETGWLSPQDFAQRLPSVMSRQGRYSLPRRFSAIGPQGSPGPARQPSACF